MSNRNRRSRTVGSCLLFLTVLATGSSNSAAPRGTTTTTTLVNGSLVEVATVFRTAIDNGDEETSWAYVSGRCRESMTFRAWKQKVERHHQRSKGYSAKAVRVQSEDKDTGFVVVEHELPELSSSPNELWEKEFGQWRWNSCDS